MIVIADYGLGNVEAFLQLFNGLNVPARRATDATGLDGASKIVLPGVGAFDWAMARLSESGMRTELERRVLEDEVPILGVCVGMQMMCRSSEEGSSPGLGWVDGVVRRFSFDEPEALPLPHMGWNSIQPTEQETLFQGLGDGRFYFLHSYYVDLEGAPGQLATSRYGREFTSAIGLRNIFGTQFHPEKSHDWGVGLLKNFAEL